MAKQKPKHVRDFHSSADYFEPLFRAALVRAMKKVQTQTSINRLAMGIANMGARAEVIPRRVIEDALQPLKKIVRDAYRKGGKIGAKQIEDVLNG